MGGIMLSLTWIHSLPLTYDRSLLGIRRRMSYLCVLADHEEMAFSAAIELCSHKDVSTQDGHFGGLFSIPVRPGASFC